MQYVWKTVRYYCFKGILYIHRYIHMYIWIYRDRLRKTVLGETQKLNRSKPKSKRLDKLMEKRFFTFLELKIKTII